MNWYLIFAAQLLLAGLVVWRMRQRSEQPVGCLAGGFVVLWIIILTSMMFVLAHAIFQEGLLADVLHDGRGSLAAVSPGDWALSGMVCLMLVLMAAGTCSLAGFAITGHHPKFCRTVWKTLTGVLLLPVVSLGLLAASFGCAFVVCMRIASPMFDDVGWGWLLLLIFFSGMSMLGFVGLVVCMLELNGDKLKEYNPGNKDRSYRRANEEPAVSGTTKGGAL